MSHETWRMDDNNRRSQFEHHPTNITISCHRYQICWQKLQGRCSHLFILRDIPFFFSFSSNHSVGFLPSVWVKLWFLVMFIWISCNNDFLELWFLLKWLYEFIVTINDFLSPVPVRSEVLKVYKKVLFLNFKGCISFFNF